jgi:hypothetical protein
VSALTLVNEKDPSFAAGPTYLGGGWIAAEGDRLRIRGRILRMSSQED